MTQEFEEDIRSVSDIAKEPQEGDAVIQKVHIGRQKQKNGFFDHATYLPGDTQTCICVYTNGEWRLWPCLTRPPVYTNTSEIRCRKSDYVSLLYFAIDNTVLVPEEFLK